MEDFYKMNDDLERVIEKDDTSSTVTGSDCEETLKHGPLTLRQKLDNIIHSSSFQIGIIVLVIFDVLLVLGELLFDLEIINLKSQHQESVPHALHYCSIGVLSLFIIEIAVRIFVMRLTFFKHKLELFDALIVTVSFVLDIVFRDREDAASGVGLLVILRLWRVTRILNGIILSVKRQAEKKIERERHLKEACEQELTKFRTYCTSLEGEIDYLHRLLKQHGIQYTEKVQKRPVSSQISVEVEVNLPALEQKAETSDRRPGTSEQNGNGNGATGNGAAAVVGHAGREGRSAVLEMDGKDYSDILTLESSVTLA